ncbi:MAG: transglycosylase SLT domain-containing protein [Gammaproteobacteria bacterium]|nr:transglycosylase SLT domain-containing protein [Gammaproteobacteria bacterium]MCP5416647.1 transglycosylase SLT domain-containing protein [Chromatiaceae bacterium]
MIQKFRITFIILLTLTPFLSKEALSLNYAKVPIEKLQAMALQGDQIAQVELATALEHGEGIKKDIGLAISWYCQAAGRGSRDAQRSLGWIYANGKGVERDDQLAAYWLNKAADSGDDYAARLVKRIVDHVGTPDNTGCSHVANAHWLGKRCNRSDCRHTVKMVEKLALDYQLDANLVLAVIAAESAFDPLARSVKDARGLMQLIPETAARFGVTDSWDKEQNLRGGMAYLRWLLAFFNGNVEYALAGYNAGENRVTEYQGVPPFSETKAYVRRILTDYGKRFHTFDKKWLKRSRPAVVQSLVQREKRVASEALGG